MMQQLRLGLRHHRQSIADTVYRGAATAAIW